MSDITLSMINDFFKVSEPISKAPTVVQIKGPPKPAIDDSEPEFRLPKKPHELK